MVFCKECKYFKGRRLDDCNHPGNLKDEHDWQTQWKTHNRLPEYINRINNCKWFEGK